MRRLLPLPVTVMASPLPGRGLPCAAARAPRKCAGPSRRAAPARRRRGRGSTARVPRRRADRCRRSRLAAEMASGFGSVLATFGARTAASAPTWPLPLRSRKRANERTPASARISERPPMPSARRAAMKARTSARREPPQRRERDAAAQMFGEEGQELPGVAVVGLDGLRRHAPLGAEMSEPARQLAPRLRARRREAGGGWSLLALTRWCIIAPPSLPFLKHANHPGQRMATTRRRCSGAGRARPRPIPTGCRTDMDLVAGRRRLRAARRALGDGGGVGGESKSRSASRQPPEICRATSSTCRRSSPSCASSSTGSPIIRSARAAWCCACACAWASISAPSASGSASGLRAPAPKRMTLARQRVLALLADGLLRAKGEAAEEAGVSSWRYRRPGRRRHAGNTGPAASAGGAAARSGFPHARFHAAQRDAADALRATVARGGYAATLLDGVTGSGKTEVYFEAVAETVRRGRQTLILMPEISLTGQFLDRFAERFGVRPARMAFGSSRRASVHGPGRRLRPARSASSSARARRCSCPTPISGSSSSMRSTIRPTSRKTACTTTRATWRWCAPASTRFRSCWPRPRRRSRPRSMRGAGAISRCICRSALAVSICR